VLRLEDRKDNSNNILLGCMEMTEKSGGADSAVETKGSTARKRRGGGERKIFNRSVVTQDGATLEENGDQRLHQSQPARYKEPQEELKGQKNVLSSSDGAGKKDRDKSLGRRREGKGRGSWDDGCRNDQRKTNGK